MKSARNSIINLFFRDNYSNQFVVVKGTEMNRDEDHAVFQVLNESCMKTTFTNNDEKHEQVPEGRFNTIRFSEERLTK